MENREVKNMLQLETLSENMKMIQLLINLKLLRIEFKQNVELMECVELLSRSIGIMEFIRRVPYNLRNYEVYLPEDIMFKHNVNPKNLCDRNRGKAHPDLNDVILEYSYYVYNQGVRGNLNSISNKLPSINTSCLSKHSEPCFKQSK